MAGAFINFLGDTDATVMNSAAELANNMANLFLAVDVSGPYSENSQHTDSNRDPRLDAFFVAFNSDAITSSVRPVLGTLLTIHAEARHFSLGVAATDDTLLTGRPVTTGTKKLGRIDARTFLAVHGSAISEDCAARTSLASDLAVYHGTIIATVFTDTDDITANELRAYASAWRTHNVLVFELDAVALTCKAHDKIRL